MTTGFTRSWRFNGYSLIQWKPRAVRTNSGSLLYGAATGGMMRMVLVSLTP